MLKIIQKLIAESVMVLTLESCHNTDMLTLESWGFVHTSTLYISCVRIILLLTFNVADARQLKMSLILLTWKTNLDRSLCSRKLRSSRCANTPMCCNQSAPCEEIDWPRSYVCASLLVEVWGMWEVIVWASVLWAFFECGVAGVKMVARPLHYGALLRLTFVKLTVITEILW